MPKHARGIRMNKVERNIKYKCFFKDDVANNRGLIVNQLEEIRAIMNFPEQMQGVTKGYLYNLLYYTTHNSDYYKEYSNFKSINDFPLVDKEILKQNYKRIFVSEYEKQKDNKEKRTGTPFTVYWDHRKHMRMIADIKYYAELAGAASHEPVVCLIVTEKGDRTPLEKQEQDNVYNVYCGYFDDKNIARILQETYQRNPKIVIGYASMWKAIANYIYEGKTEAYEWNISAILSEAETLDERSREILNEYFGCPIYSRYGNEENGILAQEDGSGLGHRFNTASYFLEILKMDRDEPAEDGEIGRVVITDLFNYAFPMIRYVNGDLAIRSVTNQGQVYLSSVLGRQIDMLYATDGKPVNWLAGVIFLKKYRDIRQFQLIQESSKTFKWVLNTTNHEYEDIINKETKNIFGEDADIHIQYVDEIPKLQSGKTQMTICRLNK